MIWLIVGAIISIVIIGIAIVTGFKVGAEEDLKIIGRLHCSAGCGAVAVLMSVVIMCISFLCAMVCGTVLHSIVATEKNVSASQEIVALKDNNNISGRFYLGSGQVQEDSYYYYMIKGNNGLDMKKISTDKCSLQFDENPRIETITYEFQNPIFNWIAMDETTDYIIYCPEGTVNYQFQVDLQ